jgi:uncharacterized SAM-binding protein YcdF (DUF218 family)
MSCNILLILAGIFAASAAFTGWKILQKAQGSTGDFDWLLVLGTHVRGTEPTRMLRDRIEAAAAYLKAHPDTRCIVSGCLGRKSELTEAECLYRELTALGIEESRIYRETKAGSTMENLKFSKALIEKLTGNSPQTLGILSSEYHLLRAQMCANRQGITPVLLPAKTSHKSTLILYFLREILAVWYYAMIYPSREETL